MGKRYSKDRSEIEEIEKSLNVSSYLNEVIQGIETGEKVRIKVPNLKTGSRGEAYSIESGGLEMGIDTMASVALKSLGGKVPASQNESLTRTRTTSSIPQKNLLTANQERALKKFPSLIDFLGQEEGEKIARKIAEEVNVSIVAKIGENAKKLTAAAATCKADKQNIKQYFVGDDWVCCVTASGPFRGDEAIYYSRKKDTAAILRYTGNDWENVSESFNVIYDTANVNSKSEDSTDSTDVENNDE